MNFDNSSDNNVKVIKEMQDPNDTHKYTMKKVNKEITKQLNKLGFNITFNQYDFQLFANYYDIKSNPKFCYINKIGSSPMYSYSIQAIDFIVNEYKRDATNIIENLKSKLKDANK